MPGFVVRDSRLYYEDEDGRTYGGGSVGFDSSSTTFDVEDLHRASNEIFQQLYTGDTTLFTAGGTEPEPTPDDPNELLVQKCETFIRNNEDRDFGNLGSTLLRSHYRTRCSEFARQYAEETGTEYSVRELKRAMRKAVRNLTT